MAFPSKTQQQVIDYDGPRLVVVAAPGTGKTSTIVARMTRLLKENPDREISFITFTRASRRDTEKKLREEVGNQALDAAMFDFPRISTLHTYAKSIVYKYSGAVGRDPHFSVLIEDRAERALVLAESMLDLDIKLDLTTLKKSLSHYRNTGAWPTHTSLSSKLLTAIFDRFSSLLEFYNTIDIDGLVPTARDILAGGHAELPPVFLQVDEYQDMNPVDQELIALTGANKNSRIVVVGDDAQSIYSFRDARYLGLRTLWESATWEPISFPDSHRLPAHIVRASHALIRGRGYLGENLTIPADNGERISLLQCTTSDMQIEVTSSFIAEYLQSKKNRKGDPLVYGDFMVLCPTGTLVSKTANALQNQHNIPTKQRERATIPDDYWRLLLLLRMFKYQDSLALRQWLEIIEFDPDEIQQLRRQAMEAKITLYDFCSKAGLPKLDDLFGSLAHLEASEGDGAQFQRAILEFPDLLVDPNLFPDIGFDDASRANTPARVPAIIRSIHERFGLLDADSDIPDDPRVLVTTLHSAKGLEAEFVFILWLNSDFMPSPGRDAEEERRVLYVALTRAKQDVALLFHEKFDGRKRIKEDAMSPFLRDISEHLKIARITRADFS